MKRRLVTLFLAGVLAFSWVGVLSAGAAELLRARPGAEEEAAQALYSMGLLLGTTVGGEPDFALDSQVSRGEAITMVVRLLGAEEEVLAASYPHPFTDVTWESPYVGYAYVNGISKGTGTAFGSATLIDTDQFVTLVLRALGYDQVDWQDPYPTADEAGLEYSKGPLLRGGMAAICYSALFCRVNGTQDSLYRTLVDGGAIEGPYAGLDLPPAQPLVTYVQVNSPQELAAGLAAINAGRAMGPVYIGVPAGEERTYMDMLGEDAFDICGELAGISYAAYSGFIWFEGQYRAAVNIIAYLEGKLTQLPEGNYEATLEKAMEVVDAVIDDSMDDYEKVKALHDYLGNNTSYGMAAQYDDSFSASGPLLEGMGVCSGYADAFHLLCYLAGIECIQVGGTAVGGSSNDAEGHAWNKVKVDGQWYNVDVTYDDPIYIGSNRNKLVYDYFLVSDETLDRDHDWARYPHLPAAPEDYE